MGLLMQIVGVLLDKQDLLVEHYCITDDMDPSPALKALIRYLTKWLELESSGQDPGFKASVVSGPDSSTPAFSLVILFMAKVCVTLTCSARALL